VTSAPQRDPVLDFVLHVLTAHVAAGLVAGAFMLAERLS
jgi:hypothetical protein